MYKTKKMVFLNAELGVLLKIFFLSPKHFSYSLWLGYFIKMIKKRPRGLLFFIFLGGLIAKWEPSETATQIRARSVQNTFASPTSHSRLRTPCSLSRVCDKMELLLFVNYHSSQILSSRLRCWVCYVGSFEAPAYHCLWGNYITVFPKIKRSLSPSG